jgi:hypothetical protein
MSLIKTILEVKRLNKKDLVERVFARLGASGFSVMIDVVEGRTRIDDPNIDFKDDPEIMALIGMIRTDEFLTINVDDTENGTKYNLTGQYKYVYVFGTGYSGASVVFTHEDYNLVEENIDMED